MIKANTLSIPGYLFFQVLCLLAFWPIYQGCGFFLMKGLLMPELTLTTGIILAVYVLIGNLLTLRHRRTLTNAMTNGFGGYVVLIIWFFTLRGDDAILGSFLAALALALAYSLAVLACDELVGNRRPTPLKDGLIHAFYGSRVLFTLTFILGIALFLLKNLKGVGVL